jgi:hypothetical protein
MLDGCLHRSASSNNQQHTGQKYRKLMAIDASNEVSLTAKVRRIETADDCLLAAVWIEYRLWQPDHWSFLRWITRMQMRRRHLAVTWLASLCGEVRLDESNQVPVTCQLHGQLTVGLALIALSAHLPTN